MTTKSSSSQVALNICNLHELRIEYSFTGLTHWQHPSFFAYFPTACTFEGILGDLYASSTANPGFNVSV